MKLSTLIFLQLIAHFIGDYYFQTGEIAKRKASSYFYTFLHSLFYVIPHYILWAFYQFHFYAGIYISICAWSHMLIDFMKCYSANLEKKANWYHPKLIYIVDQLLHIVCIVGTLWLMRENMLDVNSILNQVPSMVWKEILILVFAYQPYHVTYCILSQHDKRIYNPFDKKGMFDKWIAVIIAVSIFYIPFIWILVIFIVCGIVNMKMKKITKETMIYITITIAIMFLITKIGG